ncbi:MAG: hypothetical protein LBR28_06935 [Bacteroidales bacterium]|jgi:hypothetical protein|nr:hypothetical protein [Bacteroidales bacterium]
MIELIEIMVFLRIASLTLAMTEEGKTMTARGKTEIKVKGIKTWIIGFARIIEEMIT